MRRVYHRFPQNVDLDFEVHRPFRDLLRCLQRLHNTHTTERQEGGLLKRRILFQISDGRTQFVSLDTLPPLEETVSETADFRVDLQETLLTPERRLPVSANIFLLRVVDKGPYTECFVAKEGQHGGMDAMNLRTLLKGACE
ncbi:hypothetical protein ABH15_03095 [Methanoculleus taiwanensis]|uniref:Uncharacterized protein n=1 Tax=Methanoculleus taiwanensis TaxID=1550565 RepID=A0A498H635_9EURY|nr:hypothetical protein [Methanoculleus taiwanensis]RXE57124.1 hypothetical protein ABH15_03095 [Methanoculleus taiwanensis]